MQLTATRKQLRDQLYGSSAYSGFMCVAHTPGYSQECSIPLPQDAQELRAKLADAFGMQLASVSMRARCAEGTGTPQEIWALLDTQSDLEAALQEANECGMHQLHVEVDGRSSLRSLDAMSGALGLASAASFAWCALLLVRSDPAPESATPAAQLALAGLLLNGLTAAAAVVLEQSDELATWLKGAGWPALVLSPLSLEVLLLASSGAGGFSAPLSARGRTMLLSAGSLLLLLLRAAMLWVLQARAPLRPRSPRLRPPRACPPLALPEPISSSKRAQLRGARLTRALPPTATTTAATRTCSSMPRSFPRLVASSLPCRRSARG